jgi:hypothetical protein
MQVHQQLGRAVNVQLIYHPANLPVMRLIFLLAMLFVISAHIAVAEIAGRGTVIDGDTIVLEAGQQPRYHPSP